MLFSYSRLKRFEECPRAFYKKYVLEVPEKPAENTETGKAVHQVISELLTGVITPEETGTAVQRVISGAPVPIDGKTVLELVSHPMVASLIDLAVAEGRVEDHFELPLDGPGSPVIQGYIDLWWRDPSKPVLVDWKTNHKPYGPLDTHQLGIYSWAVAQMTGVEQVVGHLVFLRFINEKRCFTYGPEEMGAARMWALTLANDIEARLAEMSLLGTGPDELFPAQPGKQCRWCSYAEECLKQAENGRSGAVTAPAEGIKTAEEAEAIAAEIFRLEKALSDMKGMLKDWVQNNGPVRVGSQEFRMCPTVSWSFPPEKLKEFCAALNNAGLNPWEYLTIGSSQLKKIGWAEEDLSRFGKKKETVSFRQVKAESGAA